MPKFMTGFVTGVFTGWLFHDAITRRVQNAVSVASEKTEDVAEPSGEKASTSNPATGSGLDPERIVEINNATVEEPVFVTHEEMEKMHQVYLRVALGAGRLKIVGYHE